MSSEESVIVSAPSVEEAVSLGLIKLTATRDEVDIEVLDEGSRGFLGLGVRDARVKLTRVPEEARAAPEPPDRRVESEAPEAEGAPSPVPPSEAAERAESEPTVQQQESAAAASAEDVQEPEEEEAAEPQAPSEVEKGEAESPSMPEVVGGVKRVELESVVRDVASGLLQDLEVDVNLEWYKEDRPTLWVAIEGKDASALVGSRSRTLHALQYLFRALTYHSLDGDYNLVVDADGYRKRRRRSLEALAQRQAEKAVDTGKTVRLRAMPAHERRIVHITLRDDRRVETESVGRGRSRSVTIIPKRSESSR